MKVNGSIAGVSVLMDFRHASLSYISRQKKQ